jgi:hypothetical protein
MNINFKTKKFEADKIALLGLFALSLLIVHFIVSAKTALLFSEPIELPHAGLAISIPEGNGWKIEKRWEYQPNSFILHSIFTANTEKPTAWVYCQYILNAEIPTPKEWFEQKAVEFNGSILEMGQDQVAGLTVDWAYIEQRNLSSFVGTIELPYNRIINIEVDQIAGEVDTEKVFRKIIGNLNFEENRLFKDGSEIIKTIRNNGINSFIDDQNRQKHFLITDSDRQNIGFMIDILNNSEPDDKFNIYAAGHFYVRDVPEQRVLQEQATNFRCENDLSEFIWEVESNSPVGRKHTEIILENSGLMTIRDSRTKFEFKHRLSPVAIPDIFIEAILSRIIENNTEQIIVDLIDSDGKIVPTIVSIFEEYTGDEETPYVIKLELLDGQGFYQLVYLNNNRQIVRVIVQQNKRYILETVTRADIIRKFPERADFLTQKSNVLKDDMF